jgi:hypothetical protein
MHGPALLWSAGGATPGDFRVLFNRDGAAQSIAPAFPQLAPGQLNPGTPRPPGGAALSPPLPKSTATPAAPAPPERATWPACAVAGRVAFCMDLSGSIRRVPLAGGGEKAIAFGRRGSSIGAAALPGDATVLAFLGDRKTSEGFITQAFAAMDDNPAVLLSEEGSGATFVALAPWKDGALAMYIDARTALTPVHARVLRRGGDGRLEIGPDAVVFVGGGAEARMSGAIATGPSGPAFVLVPTSHGVSGFGMAAVRIDDPPKDDAPVTWSLYPNGLSPAPIAATRGVAPIRVARARPVSSEPGARAVLEIGRLGDDGSYSPICAAAESGAFSHLALEADRDGSLWLAYTSPDGTWVAQLDVGSGR